MASWQAAWKGGASKSGHCYDSLKRNCLLYILLLLLEKLSHVKCNLILSYLTNLVHILYFPPCVLAIYPFCNRANVSSISSLTMLINAVPGSVNPVWMCSIKAVATVLQLPQLLHCSTTLR